MSHLAHGAHMVEYWHWHSIHNAIETYWKGLLSHDFLPGEPYREACRIGEAMRRLAPAIAGLRVKSRCAILVSNDALTAVESFPIGSADEPCDYNRVFRFLHDAFYRANVPVDVLFPEDADDLDRYYLVAVPALYAAPESLLARLRDYALGGGTLLCTFKTAFSNEHVKVYPDRQPHLLADALGVGYSEFTYPCGVTLSGVGLPAEQRRVHSFMELVTPAPGAQVLCRYEHPHWGRYAAFTRNACGSGHAYYLACLTSDEALDALLPGVLADAGISLDGLPRFPLCVRTLEGDGRRARFYLNYSGRCAIRPRARERCGRTHRRIRRARCIPCARALGRAHRPDRIMTGNKRSGLRAVCARRPLFMCRLNPSRINRGPFHTPRTAR